MRRPSHTLNRCPFSLARSVVCALPGWFLGGTVRTSHNRAPQSRLFAECMCCYGENFTLAGMSSLLRRGQGPQKSLRGRADVPPLPTLVNDEARGLVRPD